jgi:acyl-CoA thioesterase
MGRCLKRVRDSIIALADWTEVEKHMNEMEIAERCKEVMYGKDVASHELGISVKVIAVGCVEARFEVLPSMIQGHDACHGGYIFTLADTACAYACNCRNNVTVAASAAIEFLRPAKVGDVLTAVAKERFSGGRTGLFNVTVRNQDDEEIALFRGRSYRLREKIVDDL